MPKLWNGDSLNAKLLVISVTWHMLPSHPTLASPKNLLKEHDLQTIDAM